MFSDRLRCLRKDRGLTQQQLATHLGVSRSSVSGYENGRTIEPDHATLVRIADFFGVSTDYLLGRTHDRQLHGGQALITIREFCGLVDDALRRVDGCTNVRAEDRQKLVEVLRWLLEVIKRS